MKRGEVYWADLAPRSGSEQQENSRGQAFDLAILEWDSARSARQHKAWGVSPRIAIHNTDRTRGAGDSLYPRCIVRRIQFHSLSRIQ